MGKPDDIPQDVWDAAERAIVPNLTGTVRESRARAIMAERERWQPAVRYFNSYCLDEEEDARDCLCGDDQHEAAKAFGAVIRGEGA